MSTLNNVKPALFIIILLLIPSVNAGVGIVSGSEIVEVEENTKKCISYGIYNPWDKISRVRLSSSGELKRLSNDSKTTEISPKTKHNDAVPVELCFEVPNVYEEECFFWKIGCKQECGEEIVQYKGEVLASEITESSESGTGSKVTGMVSAPLTIRVNCEESGRDLISVIGLIGIIVFGIISIVLWMSYREPASVRKSKKADKIQKKKEKLEKELKKL